MTRISRLFDGIAKWCRTRWIALHWFFRLIVVVLVAVNSFAFVYALVTGNGSGLLTSLSGLAFAYIVTDWQYWMERDRCGYPFARIGAAVTARLHRGDQKVVIRDEGDQWEIERLEDASQDAPKWEFHQYGGALVARRADQ